QADRQAEALESAAKAMALDPADPYAAAARARVHQAAGRGGEALADYERAMRLGGGILVRAYQRGLKDARLYAGALDGRVGPQMREAFAKCAADPRCDPAPRDER